MGLLLLVGALASCGGGATVATGPTVIRGVVLSSSAAAPVVYDITEPNFDHAQPVTAPTVGGVVMVRVSRTCDTGSHFTLTPHDSFSVVETVRAKDHLPVVVVLKPLRAVPTLLVARMNGHEVGWLKLDIPPSDL